jgi:hypothetical protein
MRMNALITTIPAIQLDKKKLKKKINKKREPTEKCKQIKKNTCKVANKESNWNWSFASEATCMSVIT